MADRKPNRGAVALGVVIILTLYGVGAIVTADGGNTTVVVGPVIMAVSTLAGFGLAVWGRTPVERGIGNGMLIGFGLGVLGFITCAAIVIPIVAGQV